MVRLQRAGVYNAVMLILWMVSSGLYAIFLGKDINYDLLNYHVYNPFALLQGRTTLDIAPGR